MHTYPSQDNAEGATSPTPASSTVLMAEMSDGTEYQSSGVASASFPAYFDRSSSTRLLCIVGLMFSWLCAITCIVVGSLAKGGSWTIELYGEPAKDLIVLAQNIIITICNESLGYIHSVSLRWALLREGRLEFNSNLRLLNKSCSLGPNAWYSNLLMSCGIIVTYGSSSLTFLSYDTIHYPAATCDVYELLGNSLIVLGSSLAVQSCIATWTIWYWHDWPTWSSNVMDVAAACLCHEHHLLSYGPGRSIRGVGDSPGTVRPKFPSHRQPSAFSCHKQIRCVLYALWAAVFLCCIWFAVLASCAGHGQWTSGLLRDPSYWSLFPDLDLPSAFILLIDCDSCEYHPAYKADRFTARDFAWLIVLLCTLQSLVTFTLHVAELLVNCCRDEHKWRLASRPKGGRRTSNALVALLTSYQALTLFCLKPFAHWIYSLSFFVDIINGVSFFAPQILYLIATIILLAGFATFLALRRYHGAQPVAFGHLQTLVDLIDVWPERDDRLCWGDKGTLQVQEDDAAQEDGHVVRRAGTDWKPLPPIDFDKMYL